MSAANDLPLASIRNAGPNQGFSMATCRASCLALFLLLAAPAPAQELRPPAQVGEAIPDFEFRQIVMYGDGRTRMSEYRWQPVLIEFWGTR